MRLKSYFANSVQAAVEQARAELGPEAVIVQSRKAPAELRAPGEYEVVCALLPDSAPKKTVPERQPAGEGWREELASLRRHMEALQRSVSVLGAESCVPLPSEVAVLFSTLVATGLDRELVQELVPVLCAAHSSGRDLRLAAESELSARFTVAPRIGREGARPRVAALVGPPACGKTTTLVKLTVAHGVVPRRPVQLISMDNYRVAGAEQLRSYAAILGVGFQAVGTLDALGRAIAEHQNKELILIDTPGYSAADMDHAQDLAAFFRARPDIETHLTLPASMKSADVTRVADRFAMFGPSRLLFTRLDETDTFGTAVSLAARLALPVSFLGTGQRIPDDLESASRERIIELLLGDGTRAVRLAA